MATANPQTFEDYAAFWMPFTDNQQFKRDPRMLVEAEGLHYRAADGHTVRHGGPVVCQRRSRPPRDH